MCTPLYTCTQMFWTHAHKYINPVSRFACRNETTQSRHQLSDSTPTWAFTSGTYGVSYGSTRCLIHSWAACCSDAKCCYRTQSSINWLVSCLVSLRPQENLKAASFGPRAPLWVTLLWMKLCRFPLQLVHDEGPSFVSPHVADDSGGNHIRSVSHFCPTFLLQLYFHCRTWKSLQWGISTFTSLKDLSSY